MKKHTSKIDYWIIGLSLLIFGIPVYRLIFQKGWLGAGVMFGIFIGIVGLLKSVEYRIGNEQLILKSILMRKAINIQSVRKITKATSIILNSVFATSYDRLEIFYNKYDSVMVSPKNKEAFIKDLLEINPNIVVGK